MPYRDYILANSSVTEYVGMDFESGIYADRKNPDVFWDGCHMPLEDESFDSAMATEVLEHCPDPGVVMNEAFRILKPRGTFFLTVPFLWPLHDVPYDEYRYTPYAMERLLNENGFMDIEINAMCCCDSLLAQMLGLWLRRRPMSPSKRKWLCSILFPVYKKLLEKDSIPSSFDSSVIITGLTGICKKPS